MMLLALLLAGAAQAAPPPAFFADLDQFRSRSLGLRSEREALAAQEKSTLARLLAFTPTLSAAVGKYHDKLSGPRGSGATQAVNTDYSYWRAQADWNLFRGGADLFSWNAQKHGEEEQAFVLRQQELQVELDGAKLVFRRLYLQDVLKAEAELQRLKEQSLKIGRDRYAKGRIPLQEVAKMEVDLAQQQNVVRQSEIDGAENEAAYRTLFVDSLRTQEWPLSEGQQVALGEGPGSFGTKRLESKAAAAEAGWKSERSKWLSPSLDLNVKYTQLPLKANATSEWSGSLELSFPIWSHLQSVADHAQAYAGFVRAEDEAAAARRGEQLQREFLEKKIRLSQASLVEARKVLEKSDKLYQDELRSFQLGRLSTNDLFQEQSRKIQSLLSYAQSRLAFHQSLMEACALAGLAARTCLR